MAVNIFLVCNAHIDIVWLWSWEEGVTETLSTFRTAVRKNMRALCSIIMKLFCMNG